MLGALGLVLGCSAAIAYAAGGATVQVVLPANHASNQIFYYSIKGTFAKSKLTGKKPRHAYLIALKQPSSYPCRFTEPADWRYVGPSRKLGKRSEAKSPFTISGTWYPQTTTAFAHDGWRWCVYLYSRPFTLFGNAAGAKLLARTSAVLPYQ